MTKNQTIDLLKSQMPGFYSVEQVINMIEKIEDEKTKSFTVTPDVFGQIVEDITSGIEDQNDRGNLIIIDDIEFELNYDRRIEVTNVPLADGKV